MIHITRGRNHFGFQTLIYDVSIILIVILTNRCVSLLLLLLHVTIFIIWVKTHRVILNLLFLLLLKLISIIVLVGRINGSTGTSGGHALAGFHGLVHPIVERASDRWIVIVDHAFIVSFARYTKLILIISAVTSSTGRKNRILQILLMSNGLHKIVILRY